MFSVEKSRETGTTRHHNTISCPRLFTPHSHLPCAADGTDQRQAAPPVWHPQPAHIPLSAAPSRLPSGQSTAGKDERV